MEQKDLFDGQDTNYNGNRVRRRHDGRGDSWANEHREEVGFDKWMTDIDAVMGSVVFAKTSAEEVFAEYVPDRRDNKGKLIRRYGIVALFDRKKSMKSVYGYMNTVAAAFYLSLCRTIGMTQPLAPKFFFVVGELSPWDLVEVNIMTGELGKPLRCGPGEWRNVWDAVGLLAMRERLRRWIEDPGTGLS